MSIQEIIEKSKTVLLSEEECKVFISWAKEETNSQTLLSAYSTLQHNQKNLIAIHSHIKNEVVDAATGKGKFVGSSNEKLGSNE